MIFGHLANYKSNLEQFEEHLNSLEDDVHLASWQWSIGVVKLIIQLCQLGEQQNELGKVVLLMWTQFVSAK